MGQTEFSPLDKVTYKKLAADFISALSRAKLEKLPPTEKFLGAGIYTLFYHGSVRAYEPIVKSQSPIYAGKAIPSGGRKGGVSNTVGSNLYRRLSEHAKSIKNAANLDLSDFGCRYLVVEHVWIPLGERILIEHYQPVWNVVVDGFGNHDPGKGRTSMIRPRWDTLHSGRKWAARLRKQHTEKEVLSSVRSHFE